MIMLNNGDVFSVTYRHFSQSNYVPELIMLNNGDVFLVTRRHFRRFFHAAREAVAKAEALQETNKLLIT